LKDLSAPKMEFWFMKNNVLQACAVRVLKLKTVYTTQAEYKDTNVFERRQNKKILRSRP
jgi:hypothetical protein